MLRISLRSIRAHFGRFILTVVAVALGIAFLSATLALRNIMSDSLKQMVTTTVTNDLYIVGEKTSGSDTDPTQLQRPAVFDSLAKEVADLPGIELAHPNYNLPVTLIGKSGTPVSTGVAPSFGAPLWGDKSDPALVQGKAPSGTDEIALEESTLTNSGLSIGATTTLLVNGEPQKVTVTGAYSFGAPLAGAVIIFMDQAVLIDRVYEAAQLRAASFNVPPDMPSSPDGPVPPDSPDDIGVPPESLPARPTSVTVESISITLSPDAAEIQSVVTVLTDRLNQLEDGANTVVLTKAELSSEVTETLDSVLGFINIFLLVFVVLALGVGTFIITNTFHISIRQRQREYALLRAVGASPWQIFLDVIFQAIIIGIVGSGLGLLAGTGLTTLLSSLLDKINMPLPQIPPLSSNIVVVSLVAGTLVTLVSALIPARRAALIHPLEALRQVSGVKEKSLVPRFILGILFLIPGGLGLWAAIYSKVSWTGISLGIGAGSVVLAVLILGAPLIQPLTLILGAPLRLWRPIGKISVGNVSRNPRRTAATSGALTIGMTLVAAGAVLAASTQASVSSVLDTQFHSDIKVAALMTASADGIPKNIEKTIEDTAGVGRIGRYYAGAVEVTIEPKDGKPVTRIDSTVGLLDVNTVRQDFDVPLESGSLESLKHGDIGISLNYAETHNISLGDEVTLTGPKGSSRVKVAAIADSKLFSSSIIADVDADTFEKVDISGYSLHTMLIAVDEKHSIAQVKQNLSEALAPYYIYTVEDGEDMADSLADQINIVLGVLYGLLALSIVIAILGIINTLSLAVSERTREIGLSRAIGLGRGQLTLTIVMESILTALIGTILGLLTGLSLAVALVKYLHDQGLTELAIPWAQLGIFIAGAVAAGIIASLWPALRAGHKPILSAITEE